MANKSVVIDGVTERALVVWDARGGGGSSGGQTADGEAGTGTTTAVPSSITAGTLKAANTARYGLTISNTDANGLYILLGAGTVSATVFTVFLAGWSGTGAIPYYEVPYGFTGIVTGVWTGDGSGSAYMTEIT